MFVVACVSTYCVVAKMIIVAIVKLCILLIVVHSQCLAFVTKSLIGSVKQD